MGTQPRLDLRIDVFSALAQRALVLPDLTAAQVLGAVLSEFREIEHLGDNAADYVLCKQDGDLLDEALAIGAQARQGERLILQEKSRPLPAQTQRPPCPLYLRDQNGGKVYLLQWLPALIGRHDPNRPREDWLAVDLTTHESGLRVSRRHAMIAESGGHYLIESLASNPTVIQRADGGEVAVNEREWLYPGDVVRLVRSRIALKFLALNGAAALPAG